MATGVQTSANTLGVTHGAIARACHAAYERGSVGKAWSLLRRPGGRLRRFVNRGDVSGNRGRQRQHTAGPAWSALTLGHATWYRCHMDYREIITIEPGKRGGKPCIRGLRITVYDVLEYLAAGMSEDEIVADFPDLTRDDIRACLSFAADRERKLASSPPAA